MKCLIITMNNLVYVAMAPDCPYLTSWNVQCTYLSPFWPSVHTKTGFEGTKKPQAFRNGLQGILGTLSNRRRRPHDGNRKRDISLEMSLRMYNTLWHEVVLKSRTWERGVSRRDENVST